MVTLSATGNGPITPALALSAGTRTTPWRIASRWLDLAELDAATPDVERPAASLPRPVDKIGNFVIARSDQAGHANDLSCR